MTFPMRIAHLGLAALPLLFLGHLALPAMAAEPSPRPNIIFILADDLGVNDLSCYGRKDQQTPNLDKLASQGLRFTCAYCAQPICSPSRAAIMTGKTPARLHLTTFLPGRPDAPTQKLLHPKIKQQLPLEEKTLAEYLKDAGYATACIGKWHLGGKGFLPTDQGFDVYYPGKANTTPSESEGGKGEYELTAQAEKFIADNKDRPFFLHLCHNTPHIPLGAKAELVERHKSSFHPTYAAMMETMDDCVGRIVARLDELKLSERTIVIFTSDNGGLHVLEGNNPPATHNTPFRAGKGYLYEGGLRIPAIVRWPGKTMPSVIDSPMINTDWLPTLLDLAGVTISEKLDGVSLAPALTGRAKFPAPRQFFWHFPHYTNQGSRPAGAMREGDWKLVQHYEDNHLELFNLAQDPGEQTNLAAKEKPRAALMQYALAHFRKETSAQENTPNPDFDAALAKKIYEDFDTSQLPADATAAEMVAKLRPWRSAMDAAVRKSAGK